MAGSRHYSAFISYRHLEPDAYVAERLQRMLESYRPPKGAGVKDRIEYVFLDRAELPTSKSLDQSLKDALHNSDYLIVILSEKYKESIWCMEEIRVFAPNGQNAVFAVKITDNVQYGELYAPIHYVECNKLTPSSYDKYSREPNYKGGTCRFEKIEKEGT